ncbi:MAG: phosphoribosylformylglycinamidine synthase subunit PurL [Gemmatales bacterium]|nr:MAG: phosphoribosylformylglycinamidine synthase subunit PurL [Gemmatales bacterium]
MIWEVEIRTKGNDVERRRVAAEYDLLTHSGKGAEIVRASARGYLLEGDLDRGCVQKLVNQLLVDPLVETGSLSELGAATLADHTVTVLLKPGVMDAVALSVVQAAKDLGIIVSSVRTFRRYELGSAADTSLRKVLANEAIEQIIEGPLRLDHLSLGSPYTFEKRTIPLLDADDRQLEQLSREGQLSLSLQEMRAVQEHFRQLGREPTDIELETFAQTWSEHCSHKTLKGAIEVDGRVINNLLKETIFGATEEIRRRAGAADWCVSVFADNAGVVRFDDRYHVCFKVETHNHPSAIEPYGGANTGLGGVIRDLLGTGLGAKPVCNTDVFCFAPPDTKAEDLPAGVLHPKKIMQGVVAGVRDYGNRMGIPTINGAVCFDSRYLGNPLVYCGTVGLIPVACAGKQPHPGDLIVVVGGRTGRDGIHGATFSSIGLSSESEATSGGAVQIGNAIVEKKMADVLLQARDQGLYHAITDCGAGGFSSAVGEMAEGIGAVVHLDKAPLKYEGLSYTEIWISESQERMVLAVPPEHWPRLASLCASEDVEAAVIGRFADTGRLQLYYEDHCVGDLDLEFLHHGRPQVVRRAFRAVVKENDEQPPSRLAAKDVLLGILSSWNVCSKEWIIRQYDHEVQGGSVIKPLTGIRNDGPSDAAVIMPVLGSWRGLAIGCGINPHYGDIDPYAMAALAVDEAIRNVVAVGADPSRIALLDNFCWGNTNRPEVLGSLVQAAEACRDAALAFQTPFISGKDSLNNEFHAEGRHITIPPTLLISALGQVPDVRRSVSMDWKEPGNRLYLIGTTRNEMGGSHFNLVHHHQGGIAPKVDFHQAPRIMRRVFDAIQQGLVRSCHDLSEGGLAVALAEMAFAGEIGAHIVLPSDRDVADDVYLFSESASRFVVEVPASRSSEFEKAMQDVPFQWLGETVAEPHLTVAGILEVGLDELKSAWQRPLAW